MFLTNKKEAAIKPVGSVLLCFGVVAVLAACGGGGGAAPATTTTATPVATPAATAAGTAEGIWRELAGSYSYALVEPDGQLWGLTTVSAISYTGSGVIFAEKGQIAVASGNISGTFRDVIARSCELIYTCKVTGLSSAGQLSAAGGKTISTSTVSVPDWSFTGTRESSYSAAASLTVLSGTWTMQAANPANFSAQGPLVITSAGAISVANIGGCAFSGSLTPVAGKGYFRLNATTVSGTCASGVTASQVNGVVYQTDIAGKPSALHVMWHNPAMSQYFWAAGNR